MSTPSVSEMSHCRTFALLALLHGSAAAFSISPTTSTSPRLSRFVPSAQRARVPALISTSAQSDGDGIDVSDLGLTLDDLNAPLPDQMLQVASSGSESTSRIPGVDDMGCMWEEDKDSMDVTLSIPGIRGQPPAALDLALTKNTCTLTAFGYGVWSCILRGECLPESLSFSVTDGNDNVPLISISVDKAIPGERWGGFIAGIGEDSIL